MRDTDRLPHALLLRGPEGVGKQRFAERLVASLLCETPEAADAPCGSCRGCRLLAAGTHPDFHEIAPPEDKVRIGIDQIRELIEQVSLTPQYGGRKATIVSPAESMTHAAANTLLKTLEEPPGDNLFVLVAHHAGRLPATIRSRCQIIDFPVPQGDPARNWLREALGPEDDADTLLRLGHGAPLAALVLAEGKGLEARERLLTDLQGLARGGADPLACARHWQSLGLSEALYWLLSLLHDLIRLKNGRLAHNLTHSDQAAALQGLVRGLDLVGFFRLLDVVTEARRAQVAQLNFNEQLVLESIAIEWQRRAAARVGGTK
jgi:DNA polymerase-3 subunit delta'